MLKVTRSNDLDVLVERLAGVLSRPATSHAERRQSPLEPEIVLIQSAGMERYLSRELALRHGIVLGVRFPYPRAFLVDSVSRALGLEPAVDPFARERLSWTLLSLLDEDWDASELAPTRRRLGDDPSGERRFFLAERLAHLFDQYSTYRPELLRAFEQGSRIHRARDDIADLEAHLFRRALGRLGPLHFAALARRFLDEVDDDRLGQVLPKRLSIVGGVGLPPLFLRLFERMSRVIDVELLSFSPSAEYFAGLSSFASNGEPEELPAGVHPLLASLGKLGGDFQQVLEETLHEQVDVPYRVPERATLLATLQADITSAERRTELLAPELLDDGSIEVVSCHGPRREVEVVTERIFSWFAEDPSLAPEDIVVLLPDVELYAPLVSSVLGARKPRLPHRVADRSERSTSSAARALLSGLSLLDGRFKVSDVLDFLQLEPVLAKFAILPSELETIGEWVERAGIRWGRDARHKASVGMPNTDEHTWALGLERLLLGFVLDDDGETLFRARVPVAELGAGDADLLGRFLDFARTLIGMSERLVDVRTMDQLSSLVQDFAAALIGEPQSFSESSWDTVALLRGVRAVFARTEDAGFERTVPLSVVLHLLELELEQDRSSTEFLAGGVTFCALLPLRTIPFRRVCVLGLDQGSFPRADQRDELDLLALAPRAGDRTLRDDDRYLFLELLLSARDGLYLSYVGRSIQDDSERPPSVVIGELLRTCAQMVAPADTGALPRSLSVRCHPLQPFSPRYFAPDAPPSMRSSDPELFRAAQALAESTRAPVRPFASPDVRPAEGGAPAPSELEVSLDELVRFIGSPARALLRALEVRVDDRITAFEDRERVDLDALEGWALGQRLLETRLGGRTPSLAIERGRGGLPVGASGELVFLERDGGAAMVADAMLELSAGAPLERELDGEFGPEELASGLEAIELGRLAGGLPSAPVRVRGRLVLRTLVGDDVFGLDLEPATHVYVDGSYSKIGARSEAKTYVRHLAVSALSRGPERVRSYLVGRGGAVGLDPLPRDEARGLLARLVALEQVGRRARLPFFIEPSWSYLSALDKAEGETEGVARARAFAACFRSSFAKDSRAALDAEELLVFRGVEPPDGFDDEQQREFHALSHGLLSPLRRIRRPT